MKCFFILRKKDIYLHSLKWYSLTKSFAGFSSKTLGENCIRKTVRKVLNKYTMQMKKIIIIVSFIALVFSSCSNQSAVDLSDPLNSGRGFIEASLKGDYIKAEKYILPDSTNMQYLEGLKDFNKKSDKIERENYREANIIVDSLIAVSDSENILYYY